MSKKEKDDVEIIKIDEKDSAEEDLDPEEIKELEAIIEEVGEDEEEEEEEENDLQEDKDEDVEEETDEEQDKEEEEVNEEEIEEKDEIKVNKNTTGLSQQSETTSKEEADTSSQNKPPIISGHIVPTEECWVIKRNKSGFTLPKELRDILHPEQNFAVVFAGHELSFYMINEDDIPKLNIAHKKVEKTPKGKKGKRSKKKREGPEPDFPRYFHFELEDQGKIQEALESAFYKFAENPPAVSDAMNVIIYCLTSFEKGQKMNDSRLRQTVIFFLCHIIELFNQPQLIDFIQREILDDIESPYLYQISLNQLAYTSFIMGKPEKADEFITKCVEVIHKYESIEMYAIMDSFKHLIHTLSPIQGKQIPKEDLSHVKSALDEYADKLEDFDYQVQYIEMLERMNFIEDAYNKATIFMDKLDEESPLRDQFKEIRRRIGNKPV